MKYHARDTKEAHEIMRYLEEIKMPYKIDWEAYEEHMRKENPEFMKAMQSVIENCESIFKNWGKRG